MTNAVEVPICVPGGITKTTPSICLDGATHLVHTAIVGAIRVRPTNDEARKALESFEDAKVMVTVCGYQRKTEHCSHIDAYYVGLSEDFSKGLEQSIGAGS